MEQEIAEKKASLWSRHFFQMCGLNLTMFIGFHMLIATFPFFVRSLGGDEAMAGLAAGIFSIAAVLCRPVVGWALDNKGRRNILLLGLVGMVLMPLFYSVCAALMLAIILRVLHGAVWSTASTASNTLVCDILPRERFAEGMGYFGLTSAFSTAIAPVVGLYLMNAYGFSILFYASAVLSLLALLSGLGVKSAALPADRPQKSFLHSFKTLLNKDALPATVVIFFFLMPYGAVNTFVAMYAAESGMGLANGGIFFTFMAVTTAIIRVVTGRIADKSGEAPMVYIGNTCLIVSLLLLAFFPNLPAYIISALFFGAGFGMMTPSMQAMAMRIAPPERRGSASSTFFCGFDIGIGLGGIISGVLVRSFGYTNMFSIMMLGLFCSLAYYFFWGRKHASAFAASRKTVD